MRFGFRRAARMGILHFRLISNYHEPIVLEVLNFEDDWLTKHMVSRVVEMARYVVTPPRGSKLCGKISLLVQARRPLPRTRTWQRSFPPSARRPRPVNRWCFLP